jgi:hypothetical protein
MLAYFSLTALILRVHDFHVILRIFRRRFGDYGMFLKGEYLYQICLTFEQSGYTVKIDRVS